MEIQTLGVIGAGQMGNGIAQVAAMSGLDVIMNDSKQEFVERGLKKSWQDSSAASKRLK